MKATLGRGFFSQLWEKRLPGPQSKSGSLSSNNRYTSYILPDINHARRWRGSKQHNSIPETSSTSTSNVEKKIWVYLEGRREKTTIVCTYPNSLTTGTWSNPLSRRISIVFSQVTVGNTVKGAERHNSWTFRFHHLGVNHIAKITSHTRFHDKQWRHKERFSVFFWLD